MGHNILDTQYKPKAKVYVFLHTLSGMLHSKSIYSPRSQGHTLIPTCLYIFNVEFI